MPKGNPGRTKSPEHIEKLRQAAKARYANKDQRAEQSERMKKIFVENPNARQMHTKEAREKQGATLKKLWNGESSYRETVITARQQPEAIAKLRTAAINQWSDPESRARLSRSMQEKNRSHITSEHQRQLDDSDWLVKRNQELTLTEIAHELGCAQSLVSVQFTKFGLIPKSHPRTFTGGEQLVLDFVEELGITNVIHRANGIIPPLEIDIYLPDHKVGIEYHGTYWHSYDRKENPVERQRHLRKLEAATAAGIRLLQFWDYEWLDESYVEISKSIVRAVLGMSTRIGARECEIKTPSNAEVTDFLVANHIQQSRPFTFAAGLYSVGELVMVMTLGRSRYVKGAWEMLRLATKKDHVVVGGAQRLWSSLISKLPHQVLVYSYADRRLFSGQVYSQLGFTLKHHTVPGYQYFLDGTVYSRLQFQKHKQATRLAVYDATLTEAENMFANGYRRLWDAGQAVWVNQLP
jgi:hypothetical protein